MHRTLRIADVALYWFQKLYRGFESLVLRHTVWNAEISSCISADGMRKELFYVAASRGGESITVVTSDKDLLRHSVAHSVARQSASELSRKAQGSLKEGGLKPSLRERERPELPVAREQGHDTVHEGRALPRKAPAAETVQTINREEPSREQKQEHVIEPSYYYGISR